jgi:DNA-binding LytR/AlgR family response regulator
MHWRGRAGCILKSPLAGGLVAGPTRLSSRTSQHARTKYHKPVTSQVQVPPKWVAPVKSKKMLEGFCPEPLQEEQIVVNSDGRMLSLRLADIEWLEAVDDCVALHVGERTFLLRETLAVVAAKLPSERFLRISPSTVVNCAQIRALRLLFRRRCGALLRNGTTLTLMCACCEKLGQAGLGFATSNTRLVCPLFTVPGTSGN